MAPKNQDSKGSREYRGQTPIAKQITLPKDGGAKGQTVIPKVNRQKKT